MYVLVMVESCCNHFAGVLGSGTLEEMEKKKEVADGVMPVGYSCYLSRIHDDVNWVVENFA